MQQAMIDKIQQDWLIEQCRGRTLHVGCGPKPIGRPDVINIDPNPGRLPHPNLTLDVRELDQVFVQCCFDSVVSSHVLPAIDGLEIALLQIHRVLKYGGTMAHVIPDWRVAPQRTYKHHAWDFQHQGWDGPEDFRGWWSEFETEHPGLFGVVELASFEEFKWSFKFVAKKV